MFAEEDEEEVVAAVMMIIVGRLASENEDEFSFWRKIAQLKADGWKSGF